jgi:AcrR family transcriptional regulator
MQAVAARVGVKAPSLYKRVRDRDTLIGLIADATARDLGRAIDGAGNELVEIARAFRAFARSRPHAFALLFATGLAVGPSAESLATASSPLIRATEAIVGAEAALPAARTLTAWAYGFVTMELSGAFQLGGDVDHAFEYGVGRIAAALGAD